MDILIVYGLVGISLLITMGAQAFISSSYSKYSKQRNSNNLTGAEAARIMLDKNGLTNVKVQMVSGYLSDHYDPRNKTVNLSTNNYNEPSVASVAVACHECGHALQDKNGYTFLKIRRSIIPIVNFCSYAGYLAIILGSVLGFFGLIWLGIIAECIILFFQLVTLPVEFNASKRALQEIEKERFLTGNEISSGKTMLTSAALTYVASVATTVIQILRLVLMYGKKR